MDQYADLEMGLAQPVENIFMATFRFDRIDNPAQIGGVQARAEFDLAQLRQNPTDLDYGTLLRQSLFGSPDLANYFRTNLAICQAANLKMRLRLVIDRSANVLNSLRWETLLHPDQPSFLTQDSNLPFSRFIYSTDMRKVELRPKEQLRALVVVSAPTDLADWGLDEVDATGELQRAQEALKSMDQIDVLAAAPLGSERVTGKNLLKYLQKGYDIIHLVCHGKLDWVNRKDQSKGKRPFLWLEQEDGTAERVDGETLVGVITNLDVNMRPRLITLVSCQSGGTGLTGDEGVFSALGPRLAEVGIPAVVAMQANVSMLTMNQFLPPFYAKLAATGRVDQAMADGRALVADKHDWWAPVLFLRLRGGVLWYQAGVADPSKAFQFWGGITARLQDKRCTPIIGSELLSFMVGTQEQIARDWAQNQKAPFPLVMHDEDELPQVAQYLMAYLGINPATHEMRWLKSRLSERYGAKISPGLVTRLVDYGDLDVPDQAVLVNDLISEVGRLDRQQNPDNPFAALADLPVKVYITTTPDNLLEDALRERTTSPKDPQSLYLCWRSELLTADAIRRYTEVTQVEPTIKKPLVYHLFGSLQQPASLVLTEDDYFEYLMWINKPSLQIPIPKPVTDAFEKNALLFLGFRMSDWNFRLLFRSILNGERRVTREAIDSLAVQLKQGEDYIQPERARQVLEKVFTQQRFNLYWGRSTDFLRDLRVELAKK